MHWLEVQMIHEELGVELLKHRLHIWLKQTGRQRTHPCHKSAFVPGCDEWKQHIFRYIYSDNILLKARELCEQQEKVKAGNSSRTAKAPGGFSTAEKMSGAELIMTGSACVCVGVEHVGHEVDDFMCVSSQYSHIG